MPETVIDAILMNSEHGKSSLVVFLLADELQQHQNKNNNKKSLYKSPHNIDTLVSVLSFRDDNCARKVPVRR